MLILHVLCIVYTHNYMKSFVSTCMIANGDMLNVVVNKGSELDTWCVLCIYPLPPPPPRSSGKGGEMIKALQVCVFLFPPSLMVGCYSLMYHTVTSELFKGGWGQG